MTTTATTSPASSFRLKASREVVSDLLVNKDPFVTSVFLIAYSVMGDDAVTADPLVVYVNIEEEYGIIQLSSDVESKINAFQVILGTDSFHTDPAAFISVANTLSNGDPGFEYLEDLIDVEEMLWALYEVSILTEDADDTPLSSEVTELIAEILAAEDDLSAEAALEERDKKKALLVAELQTLGVSLSQLP